MRRKRRKRMGLTETEEEVVKDSLEQTVRACKAQFPSTEGQNACINSSHNFSSKLMRKEVVMTPKNLNFHHKWGLLHCSTEDFPRECSFGVDMMTAGIVVRMNKKRGL